MEPPRMRLALLPTKELYILDLARSVLKPTNRTTPKAALAHSLGRFGASDSWIFTFRMANSDASFLHTLLHPRRRRVTI